MIKKYLTYIKESDDFNNLNGYKVGDVIIYDLNQLSRYVNNEWHKGTIIEIDGNKGNTKIERDNGEIEYVCVCPFCDQYVRPYIEPKIIKDENDPYGEEDWNK